MRVLIVDDNLELSILTGQLLLGIREPAPLVETVSLAGDLEAAIRFLPEYDAVLCAEQFPISRNSSAREEEWDLVYREAVSRGIRFVLYSDCSRCLDEARNNGIPAVPKPGTLEEIQTALAGRNLKATRPHTTPSRADAEKDLVGGPL